MKGPWLGPGGAPLTLTAMTGFRKHWGGWVFSQGRLLGSERVHDNPERQDYGMLVNEWAWLSLDGHEFVVRVWTEMEHAWL